MTKEQKTLRKFARYAGARTLQYLRYALYPVYTNDYENWIPIAVRHAREAWRYAQASVVMAGDRQEADRASRKVAG